MWTPHSSVQRAWQYSNIPLVVSWKKYDFHHQGTFWFDCTLRIHPWRTFVQTRTYCQSWHPWLGEGIRLWDRLHLDRENRCKSRSSHFFLVMGMMLATQSRCYSFLMEPESISFLTFDWIASIISGRNHRCCCLTSFTFELMLRRCIATRGSKPGMSS